MWGAVASQSAWLIFVVLLNSFIHTLMYTYFLLKTLYPKMEIKSARYLTTAQIGQFLFGSAASIGVLIMGDSYDSASLRFSLTCLHVRIWANRLVCGLCETQIYYQEEGVSERRVIYKGTSRYTVLSKQFFDAERSAFIIL